MRTNFMFLSIIYKISKLDIYKCPKKCPKKNVQSLLKNVPDFYFKKMSKCLFLKENDKK